MPLILLSGQPCSGKSRVAAQLADHLKSYGLEVFVISEESLGLERNAAYKDARSEKETRGLLKAAVDRTLRGKRAVLLDSINSIKGYRYELWCMAKAAATHYCVIHCELPVEVSRDWNTARSESTFSSQVFEDLVGRYEAPDMRNRWDMPLIRVDPRSASLIEDLQPAVAAATGKSVAADKRSGREALKPNLATSNSELSTTNLLNELDRAAQVVVSAIVEAQSHAGGGAAGCVQITGVSQPLTLQQPVSLPELRRHKRAFLKLSTQNNWTRVRQSEDALALFVEFLRNHLDCQ